MIAASCCCSVASSLTPCGKVTPCTCPPTCTPTCPAHAPTCTPHALHISTTCTPLAGISSFPEALGRLAALEALQLEGCPLEQPLAQIYAKSPLLLVPLHAPSSTSLDLGHIGLDTVRARVLAAAALPLWSAGCAVSVINVYH
jgi:hypothetical protein